MQFESKEWPMIFNFIENNSLTPFQFVMIIVKLYCRVVSDIGEHNLSAMTCK